MKIKQINKKAYRKYQLKERGTTQEEWDRVFLLQKQCCAICFSKNPKHKFGWATDHNHKTGKFRGILCQPCNLMLGSAYENPETLQQAIQYLGER